jgi:hypothetical protein
VTKTYGVPTRVIFFQCPFRGMDVCHWSKRDTTTIVHALRVSLLLSLLLSLFLFLLLLLSDGSTAARRRAHAGRAGSAVRGTAAVTHVVSFLLLVDGAIRTLAVVLVVMAVAIAIAIAIAVAVAVAIAAALVAVGSNQGPVAVTNQGICELGDHRADGWLMELLNVLYDFNPVEGRLFVGLVLL